MKKIIAVFCVAALMYGCNPGLDSGGEPKPVQNLGNKLQLKEQFAIGLAKVVEQNRDARAFLKEKALNSFLGGDEILYQAVKDEHIGAQTFRELLRAHFEDEKQLTEIENMLPRLAIFIPELPENSFSAKIWRTADEVPMVAVSTEASNDIPIYNSEGKQFVLESKYAPGFPVVVVKESKKVATDDMQQFSKANGSKLYSVGGKSYKFLADDLDRTIEQKEISGERSAIDLDPKIINAFYVNEDYPIYGGGMHIGEHGWQRDYIYYGISQANPNGPYDYNYSEFLRSFRLTGDGMTVYNRIADQSGDPRINNGGTSTGWSSGGFIFKVRVILSRKDGGSEELVKYFTATGQELFTVTWRSERKWFKTVYYITSVTVNDNPKLLNVELFAWDIYSYATSFKLAIEEEDLLTTTTSSETRSTEFATNFESTIEFPIEIFKIGAKFGGSAKITRAQTVTVSYTQGNDDLGSVLVNFEDKVITQIDGLNRFGTREHGSGLYSVSIEPTKVY
jgi:hypothetical protein